MEPDDQDSQTKDQTGKGTNETPINVPAATSETSNPAFGWNSYAERINGRFAMIGFVALLVLELFTRQDFFTWLGL